MLFYQVIILAAVVLIICLLAYIIKIKNRLLLLVLILIFASAGAGGLCLVQYVFSSHFYVQSVDVNELQKMKFTQEQQKNLKTIFSDYNPVSDVDSFMNTAISKKYLINKNGVSSKITVTIYDFDTNKSAEQFFLLGQRFYESKNFLPSEDKLSLIKKGIPHRYTTSYIKSVYSDYKDIIYLPSKISYQSEIMVLDNNMVVFIRETANKPVSCKNEVIDDILKTLNVKA